MPINPGTDQVIYKCDASLLYIVLRRLFGHKKGKVTGELRESRNEKFHPFCSSG
jgi:hypothetical protein